MSVAGSSRVVVGRRGLSWVVRLFGRGGDVVIAGRGGKGGRGGVEGGRDRPPERLDLAGGTSTGRRGADPIDSRWLVQRFSFSPLIVLGFGALITLSRALVLSLVFSSCCRGPFYLP